MIEVGRSGCAVDEGTVSLCVCVCMCVFIVGFSA